MLVGIEEWLSSQQEIVDTLISSAGRNYVANHSSRANFLFDVKTCSREMWALSKTGDLCYDRPSIGFCYSLWYHPTRVSALTGIFADILLKAKDEKEINIYDLGAGTGAVQWAISLVFVSLRECGHPTPRIRFVNIDSSPFMLEYNRDYLWPEFIKAYPAAKDITVEYSINNWSNSIDALQDNKWICASYVFDHNENKAALVEEFAKLVKKTKPSAVLLFTSTQNLQREYVRTVIEGVKNEGYTDIAHNPKQFYFKGSLKHLVAFRRELQQKSDFGFAGDPRWDQSNLHSNLLVVQQPSLPLKVESIKIYQGPEINRVKVQLTDQQESASVPTEQPTLIVGPAGCGKSIVLTERIRKIVEREDSPYDPSLQILLTTFNRKLVNVLGGWLEEILDRNKCKRTKYSTYSFGRTKLKDHSYFVFNGSTVRNIQILHFDVLPTVLANIKGKHFRAENKDYEQYHRDLMSGVIDGYFADAKLNKADFSKIADPDFMMDEFNRIFYGLQIKTRKEYLNVERLGRGNNPRLNYSSQRREIIYNCILAYFKKMKAAGVENFLMKRDALLKRIKEKKIKPTFTHILVDELQDCTAADYDIFIGLLKDKNNLTLAGDMAQSIQLGGAFHVPTGDEMKKYKKNKLEGSFRLPFRVSESIKELSERISSRYGAREGLQPEIIKPYKYAQPGARPIVVYAANVKSMTAKIVDIAKAYSCYGTYPLSIFEKDAELSTELWQKNITAGADVITKSKGLEFPLAVWSSRIHADTKLEQEEFAYTIFTRTSSLLVIAVFDQLDPRLKEIVKIFDSVKSIYWDEETAASLELIRSEHRPVDEEDNDGSKEITGAGSDETNLDEFIDT